VKRGVAMLTQLNDWNIKFIPNYYFKKL